MGLGEADEPPVYTPAGPSSSSFGDEVANLALQREEHRIIDIRAAIRKVSKEQGKFTYEYVCDASLSPHHIKYLMNAFGNDTCMKVTRVEKRPANTPLSAPLVIVLMFEWWPKGR